MDERVLTVSNLLGFLTLALVIALHLSPSNVKRRRKSEQQFVGRCVEEVDRSKRKDELDRAWEDWIDSHEQSKYEQASKPQEEEKLEPRARKARKTDF